MFLPIIDGKRQTKTIIPIQGQTTNNVAEFIGLLFGLNYLLKNNIKGADIYMDSLLVVKAMKNEHKIKKSHLKPLSEKAKHMLAKANANIHWVSNRHNLCDPHLN